MSNDNNIDYYQFLFLSPYESNHSKIKESYSNLIKIFHPDKQGISEVSQKLTEAYRVLSDPVLKFIYDNLGKDAVQLVMSSDMLCRKARKVFDSISSNALNSHHIESYKAYLLNKIKQKISQARNQKDNSSNISQTTLVFTPFVNMTSISFQQNISKKSSIGFHYEPKKKTQSYFIKYLLSVNSISSESLYVYSKSNKKGIHQTIRFKQGFASSMISYSKQKLSFNNITFGFNFSSFLLAFNKAHGVMFSGEHVLSQNKKLNYSLSLHNPHYSCQITDSQKKYNDNKELSLDANGISLRNEIYNKNSHICLNSSLSLKRNSSCLCSLSIGIKTNNFSFMLPLIAYPNFDWLSCALLFVPYVYSLYIQRRSWKVIYSVYDKISKNNHDAFIERNREYVLRLNNDHDNDNELIVVLALVGQRQLIKVFLNNKIKSLNEKQNKYEVFDITIALSLKVNKADKLIIDCDIFEIEGVYLPQYRYQNDMWYYIQYKKKGNESIAFLPNKTENVVIT